MKTPLVTTALGLIIAFTSLNGEVNGQKRRSSPPTASQLVDFDCPEEFGYYAHPGDCTQYYVCVFGGALLESCTGGLMYSHELQTCDWPRNVGCAGVEAAAAAAAQSSSGSTGSSTHQSQPIRSRPSASIPISRGSVTAQQQREPQQVAKHDLYTEEELGPAEEIETDRQQRVYRGQPPTIGQVASDRDAIAHSNAIPIQSSGGRDKLSVVSFGAQQQYTRASVAPQVYNEPATATPARNYNATQYIAQQYDPYYSIYDEEADLYKDIDYTQYTTNQGSQGQQRYRGQTSYKDRKQPTVEIVEEPVQRGATYSKSKYNTQQDLFQPSITQQDYESYNIQTNDDIQYRQPIQTKTSNRLAPIRGTEEVLGSKEEKLSALPEGVERNPNQRTSLAPRVSHPDPTSEPIHFKDDTLNQLLTETTDGPRQTTQLAGSTSTNYISHKVDSDSKQYSDITLPRAEKLIQSRKQFVIQVTTPVSSTQSDTDSKKTSYDIIKSFLEEQSKTQPAPRPFRPREESSEELNTSNRGSTTNSRGRQEEDYSISRKSVTSRGSSKPNKDEIPSRTSSSRFTNPESTQKPFVSRKSQIVEEYTISSKPLSSRPTSDAEYVSRQNLERTRYEIIDETATRRQLSNRVAPEITAIVQEYSPTRRPISSRTTISDNNVRRKPTTISGRSEISDDRNNRRRGSNRSYSDTRSSNDFSSGISENAHRYKDEFIISRTAAPKPFSKPTTETPSMVSFERELDKFNNLTPTYATETKATTANEPQSHTSDSQRYNSDSDKKSFINVLSNKQCTSNCNDRQTIRVRPTSYESETTPGITRGSTRHRGSLTYTISPNEAESPNRGTPATRVRPTLKPSTSIVSKAAEFIDIYRFPPHRPEPVYPTPQVDKTAAKCRKDVCLLPDCYCGGKDVPGDLPVEETPQIVLLTFDDSVNDLNKGLYSDLFEKGRTNPNGCPISATFYVSHEWTDYSQVQNLYATGHEIASHSVSHSFGEQFSQRKWTREIAGQREILAAYGGVRQEDIRGMRAPFLAIGGNKMFKMLYDANFTYDSSMPVYENKPPSWPYTMDYKIFHDCMIPPCPTRSYPGVWEVPMVMWQDLKGGRCSMGDACSNPPTADGVYKMLLKNFERHFTSNRAPFGLFYHAAWFTQPHHKEGFTQFIDTIVNMPEVWLVTNWQAIQWVRDPTPISRLNSFAPFQCNYPERPKKCNNPKVCNLWHKSGVRYMRTCQPCPEVYPWTGKTGIRNSRVDNEVIQE